MKLRRRKHFNAQQVFRSSLHLNDGGSAHGPNWYFRKKCYDSLRRLYTRMGLYPAGVKEGRECCNSECDWKGETDRMLGSVGPLCPDCGEVTEPVCGVKEGHRG